MSEKKTLGQIMHEGKYGETYWSMLSDSMRLEWDRNAAGTAAVCRAVMAECDNEESGKSITSEELKAYLKPFADVVKKPPKPEAASEAGDWANKTMLRIDDRQHAAKCAGHAFRLNEGAAIIREAAERHYGPKYDVLSASNIKLAQERDAARAECERLRNAEWTAEKVAAFNALTGDEVKAMGKAAKPATPAPQADAGDDELTFLVLNAIRNSGCSIDGEADAVLTAVRPLFDAVRAERDEARKEVDRMTKNYMAAEAEVISMLPEVNEGKVNPGDTVKAAEAMKAERDKLAAELKEVREACNRFSSACYVGSDKWSMTVSVVGEYKSDFINAILAAYRATKGKEQSDGK